MLEQAGESFCSLPVSEGRNRMVGGTAAGKLSACNAMHATHAMHAMIMMVLSKNNDMYDYVYDFLRSL